MSAFARPTSLLLIAAAAAATFAAEPAASAPAKAAPSPAPSIPTDDAGFTKYMSDRFSQRPDVPNAKFESQLHLTLGEIKLDLTKLREMCVQKPDDCAKETQSYVAQASQYYLNRHFRATNAAIRLLVRTPGYLTEAVKNRPADAAPILSKPLADGLVQVYALDSKRAVRLLDENDVKTLAMPADDVYKAALVNLTGELKPLDAANIAKGSKVRRVEGNIFDSSRLVLHDSWAPLAAAQGGTLIVAAPASDTVLYVGEDKPESIAALRKEAEIEFKRARMPISTELLRWTKSGWEVVADK